MRLSGTFFTTLSTKETADGFEPRLVSSAESRLMSPVESLIRIEPDNVIFKAHFPDYPITPGAVQIRVATELLENHLGKSLSLSQVEDLKFIEPLFPGAEVTYSFTKLLEAEGRLKVELTVRSEEKVFSRMSLEYSCKDSSAAVTSTGSVTVVRQDLAEQVASMVGEPRRTMVGESGRTMVGEPSRTMVGEPSRTMVGEPSRTTVGESGRTMVGEPSRTTVGELRRTTVGEPSRTTVGELRRTTVGEPSRTTVGELRRTTVGEPSRTTVGELRRTTVGEPSRTTVGELRRTTVGELRRTIEAPGLLKNLKTCVIIPVYNNAGTVKDVVQRTLRYCSDVIVVDDGSTDGSSDSLEELGAVLVRYERNRGKGYALKTGFKEAKARGFERAITIDADGQHYPEDIPVFAAEAKEHPDAMLVGSRNLKTENMPGGNTFANKFSNFWFRLQTGVNLPDTQSGFRLYQLGRMGGLHLLTCRYEAELELLVFQCWKGTRMRPVGIRVHYPPEGERVTHFRPFRDFFRISVLNTVLCVLALFYGLPSRMLRKK